ncbi:MAG TPA: winged helix-turn-helix domain-containing protein [Methanomassiliicoccales archaeon]|nr:winged helix-turn-helix domain-containing protein [Methanomassiliicoccales archaeon]
MSKEQVISKMLADEYGAKILSVTFTKSQPVQEISKACDIPIAVAYRRVMQMEEAGLLRAELVDERKRGRKVKYYKCNVSTINFCFKDGRFNIEIDWLKESQAAEALMVQKSV